MHAIPAHERQEQEAREFRASLCRIVSLMSHGQPWKLSQSNQKIIQKNKSKQTKLPNNRKEQNEDMRRMRKHILRNLSKGNHL